MAFGFNFARFVAAAAYLGFVFVSAVDGQAEEAPEVVLLGPSTYTAPGTFPSSVFQSYYPTSTSAQPQPVITDPIYGNVYPLNLTDPATVPLNNTDDPRPLPTAVSSSELASVAISQIQSIYENPYFNNSCSKCVAALEILKFVALTRPEQGPKIVVELCEIASGSNTTCIQTYANSSDGAIVTQVAAAADIAGSDGMGLCFELLGVCQLPPVVPMNLTEWFPKPKPNPLPPPKTPSGHLLKVLHLSDFHLDPRYANGAEGNCTSGLCCREGNVNKNSPNKTLAPAPRYGYFDCDTPYDLALAALEAIPFVAGKIPGKELTFDMTIFTGDLVSHDTQNELSQAYVEYVETSVLTLFQELLFSGPIYACRGNHDFSPQAQSAPNNLSPGYQQLWDYAHFAASSEWLGWLEAPAAAYSTLNYGDFSTIAAPGLRIISINDMFWYRANYFAYINSKNQDPSGQLRWLTDELQMAEDAGERVWIIGHVLSGWDGSNPLPNPTDLFYQIVDRYSPHVIANIFFGHTHEDQFTIFYANNGTNASAATALSTAWIAPSITPLTNLNSGFRMYEVDSNTFDIVDAHTWYTNVSAFRELDGQYNYGPTFKYEYSTREAYGRNISWPATAPLNATWWHHVTEQFEANPSLVQTFTQYQGKMSDLTPNCTNSDCVEAKICYMRSGSQPLGALCPQGFGSVQ